MAPKPSQVAGGLSGGESKWVLWCRRPQFPPAAPGHVCPPIGFPGFGPHPQARLAMGITTRGGPGPLGTEPSDLSGKSEGPVEPQHSLACVPPNSRSAGD